MLLKIIGAAVVMMASVGMGFYYAGRDGYRLSELAQMKKALTVLVSEIRFSSQLEEAALNISERATGVVAKIFASFGTCIREKSGEDLCNLWEYVLVSFKRESYFSDEDLDMLFALGRTFGYLDKAMQIDSIGLVISQIDGESNLLIEKREKNKRMYMNLGILGGLALVIMLL